MVSFVTHGQKAMMETMERQARLFTQLGFPEEGVMAVLVLEGELDVDEVVFYPKPWRKHWAAYQQLIEERSRR